MTAKPLTTFDRSTLRAFYDAAIAEINVNRDNILTTEFYAKTGDSIFSAGCLALSDAISDTRRMHTVSAPAGAGKTSFAYALVAAVTRYAEDNPDAPYGAVFVVDEIEKADKVFRDLDALLPNKVAIWTRDHDVGRSQPEKIERPAAKFSTEQLRQFAVVVVTHKFYLDNRGHKARSVVHNNIFRQRALTIIDEQPNEAPTIDIMLSEAQGVQGSELGLTKSFRDIPEA